MKKIQIRANKRWKKIKTKVFQNIKTFGKYYKHKTIILNNKKFRTAKSEIKKKNHPVSF